MDLLRDNSVTWEGKRPAALELLKENFREVAKKERTIIVDGVYECLRYISIPLKSYNPAAGYVRGQLNELIEDTKNYESSTTYQEYLDFISDYHAQGPFNALLLRLQKPGVRFAQTAKQWQYYYNRTPRANAKGLLILVPFTPVALVYDYEDTEVFDESRECPNIDYIEKKTNPLVANGDPSDLLTNLISNLEAEGIGYSEADFSSGFGGSIQYLTYDTSGRNKRQKKFFVVKIGKWSTIKVPHEYDLVVNKNFTPAQKFATIIHELGHYFCGHIQSSPNFKHIPKYRTSLLTSKTCEFEAESVSWLLCKRYGIESSSARYLNSYLDYNKQIPPDINFAYITKAMSYIEGMFEKNYKPINLKALKKKVAEEKRFYKSGDKYSKSLENLHR